MPMPDKMGVEFTGTQKQDIIDGFQAILTILNGIKVVQLTPDEREGALGVAETRLPYVLNAINNLAPAYPQLQPGYMSFDDAGKDGKTTGDMVELNLLVNEVRNRFTDFSL